MPRTMAVSRDVGSGSVIAVRPYTHTDHYWQVYFDTNVVIRDVVRSGGFPVPEVTIEVPVNI